MTTAAAEVAMQEETQAAPRPLQLDYLPVGLFGSVMGLTGLAVAWHIASAHCAYLAWSAPVSTAIGAVSVATFVAMLFGYGVKLLTDFDAARTEFLHPIAGNLFGTFFISALLLPIVLAPYAIMIARVLWVISAVGMIAFAWLVVMRWMSYRQQAAHATPAWVVPVVGLLDVPLALPVLGFPPMHALMFFALALGLFFSIPLFTLIFSRLLFEEPLPAPLRPSLLILIAPFAVGCSAYIVTTGEVDLFAQSLYMLTLFFLAVLLGQLRNLPVCCPFRVSWWAVSFPLAASAIATLRYAGAMPGPIADLIALLTLALATIVILGLLVRTLIGLARGELRALSGPLFRPTKTKVHHGRSQIMVRFLVQSALVALAVMVTAITPVHAQPAPTAVHYRRVQVDGLSIFYREAGPKDAPTLLLLHGYPSSSHMFRDLIPLLADRYHLIAPDYPGFGYSDAPSSGTFAYTFDHLTDVTEHFTEALGLTRYALYMQDYGGPVGFRLAVRHPERVTALIVQNANAYEDGVTPTLRDVVLRLWTDHSPEAKAAIVPLFELPATRRQFEEGAPDPSLVNPDSWEFAQSRMERPGNKTIQFLLQANYGSNPERYEEWHAYFRRYQPPTLVVWGKGDFVFAPAGAEAYRRDLKDVEVHMLDAGHFALETNAAEIAADMRSFLPRHGIGHPEEKPR